MKVIERDIFPFQEKDFFAPIRDKAAFVRLVVTSARQLLLNSTDNGVKSSAQLKLIVDQMSRLFIYKDNKYFSVAFPLTVLTDGNEVTEINTYSGKKLEFVNISAILSILDSENFKNHPSLIDFPIEPHSIDASGIYFLEEIIQFEPSYIRFDNDKKNENGDLHPLNHLDINYSQSGTYKLGLPLSISKAYFEDIQNTNTNCSFVVDKLKKK